MKNIILIIAIIGLANTVANAWIGATPAQCTGAYGAAVLVNKEAMTMEFRKEDFIYKCSFAGGVCVKIEIQHPQPLSTMADKGTKDGKPVAKPEPAALTESEVTRLLVDSGNGGKWIPGKRMTWTTEDGTRTAGKVGPALVISVALPK